MFTCSSLNHIQACRLFTTSLCIAHKCKTDGNPLYLLSILSREIVCIILLITLSSVEKTQHIYIKLHNPSVSHHDIWVLFILLIIIVFCCMQHHKESFACTVHPSAHHCILPPHVTSLST